MATTSNIRDRLGAEAVARLHAAMCLPEGATPFPWQSRLLAHFLAGELPSTLDIPTGLGKTAVMAIWAVAQSLPKLRTKPLPRRLVYVVDRRAVVDQATRVAEEIGTWIGGDAQVQADLGLDGALPISTLRGQHADNKAWLEHPERPAIVVGTVDMVGSRVLFEGYGVSRKVRPIHAAFLGLDTLFVLDEAHLVPPFEHLLRDVTVRAHTIGLCGRLEECGLLPAPRLLSLSATARDTSAECFRLDGDDFADPIVDRRLLATKRLRLEPISGAKALPGALAEKAWSLSREAATPCRILVYSNKRDDAEAAKAALEKLAERDLGKPRKGEPPHVDTALFVGARRVHERREAEDQLERLGFLAGASVPREHSAFVFATSAAEVGVDLDADHMVCDLVEFERMVQRLGRVNRRGEGSAEVHVFFDSEAEDSGKSKKAESEMEAERRAKARRAVIERLRAAEDALDASPSSLSELQGRAREDGDFKRLIHLASTPPPVRPGLERPLVEAWSMTALREHTGRPEVGPWLRGWIEDEPQTTVVWRRCFPDVSGLGIEEAKRELETFLEAAPPHLLEKVELPTHRVVSWLHARAADVQRKAGAEQLRLVVLGPALEVRDTWTAARLPHNKKQLERVLRGAILVVAADLGGLSEDGLLDQRRSDPPATPEADGRFQSALDGETPPVPFRIREEAAGTEGAHPDWKERYRTVLERNALGDVSRWLVVEKWHVDPATEDDRSMARPQILSEHQEWAEDRARRIGVSLRLPQRYIDLLALAARLHDEGKRADRWQRAFNAKTDRVYAKTKGPVNVRLLDGYRHELGSLPHAEAHPDVQALADADRDLLLHLIAAHHGFARPVISTSGFDGLPPSAVEERAREVALRFIRLQGAWGPWGLAWWESLLRCADQWASRDNDAGESR